MDLAAPHIGFVIASYALSAVLLAGLCAYVLLRDRRLREEARRLESRRKQAGQA